jgi:hypothetical protein
VRAELLDVGLEALDELPDCGFAAALVVCADVALDAVGADEPGAKAELDGADRPGALDRVAPPLATARAAAASAALVLGRAEEALLAGAGLEPDELEEAGGGATGRVVSARLDVEVDRVFADGGGVDDAERPEFDPEELLDPEPLLEPDEPEPDDPAPDELEPDGLFGFDPDDVEEDGVDETGGRVSEAGRLEDADAEFDDEAGGGAEDRFARPLPEPDEVGGEAGRDGGVNGVGVLVICGAVLAGSGFLLAGACAGVGAAADSSAREAVGRARGVSSALSPLGSVDVTLGDASVVIGTVPPPGIRRDVVSGRWLLSELTSHLHAHAADEEPSSDPGTSRCASANKVHRTPLFGRY